MTVPFELSLQFSRDTGRKPEMLPARIGRYGDIIINKEDLEESVFMVDFSSGSFEFVDPEYVEWLQNKLLEAMSHGKDG